MSHIYYKTGVNNISHRCTQINTDKNHRDSAWYLSVFIRVHLWLILTASAVSAPQLTVGAPPPVFSAYRWDAEIQTGPAGYCAQTGSPGCAAASWPRSPPRSMPQWSHLR